MPMDRAEIDQLLAALSNVIVELTSAQDEICEGDERTQFNAQIRNLSKIWRQLDDARAALSEQDLSDSARALQETAREVKTERERLGGVAKVARLAAQALEIAMHVLRVLR